MTLSQANQIVGIVILAGGLGLLAIAVCAATDGLPGTAAFIGACGLSLVGVVIWVYFQSRRSQSKADPDR